MRLASFALAAISLVMTAGAQTSAVTSDGKRVTLFDDGTWEEVRIAKPEQTFYSNSKIAIRSVSAYKKPLGYKASRGYGTEIVVEVEVTSQRDLIRPRTHRVWGYDNGSDVGGRLPNGIRLADSFGNDLPIDQVRPSYIRYNETALRPNERKKFAIISNDYPLDAAEYLTLRVNKDVFQSDSDIVLQIPTANFAERSLESLLD